MSREVVDYGHLHGDEPQPRAALDRRQWTALERSASESGGRADGLVDSRGGGTKSLVDGWVSERDDVARIDWIFTNASNSPRPDPMLPRGL